MVLVVLENAKDLAITANREFDYQTKLMEGTNEFTFSFTPDKNYPPEEYVEMGICVSQCLRQR